MLTTDVTGKSVLNMLETVRPHAHDDPSRVRSHQASSSETLGKTQEVPRREATLLWPRPTYGVAKVFSHHMTINYPKSHGMRASSGVLFNHESPSRGPKFVTRKFSQAVARIHLGTQQELALGNLETRRDWGFAGEYVDAMWRTLRQHRADDYVGGAGVSRSVRDLLDAASASIGLDDWSRYVRQDPTFMRPPDADHLIRDASKARKVLG